MRKKDLIFIVGAGRSGSTIFSKVLGESKAIVNLGEYLNYISDKNLRKKKIPCACGKKLEVCDFWDKKLINGIDNNIKGNDLFNVKKWFSLYLKSKRKDKNLENLVKNIAQRYSSINTKPKFILDASKKPIFPMLLKRYYPNLKIHVIHLVRRPTAFIGSSIRKKSYLGKQSFFKALSIWIYFNLWALSLRSLFKSNYQIVTYERFTSNPLQTVEKVSNIIPFDTESINFENDSIVELNPQHSLAGNPGKFSDGKVKISPRKKSISIKHRLLTSIFATPLYKYLKNEAS